jgi:hypothetical protein
MLRAIIASVEELPEDPQWLGSRPCPVIAYGVGAESASADVLVPDLAAARAIEKRVEAWPIAAMTLVQVKARRVCVRKEAQSSSRAPGMSTMKNSAGIR